jgi:hypothetical protein
MSMKNEESYFCIVVVFISLIWPVDSIGTSFVAMFIIYLKAIIHSTSPSRPRAIAVKLETLFQIL